MLTQARVECELRRWGVRGGGMMIRPEVAMAVREAFAYAARGEVVSIAAGAIT